MPSVENINISKVRGGDTKDWYRVSYSHGGVGGTQGITENRDFFTMQEAQDFANSLSGNQTGKSLLSPVIPDRTFGMKAVGLDFNPSGDPAVAKVKLMYAELIDTLNELKEKGMTTANSEVVRMSAVAITEAQTSQMWAVKALTWQR